MLLIKKTPSLHIKYVFSISDSLIKLGFDLLQKLRQFDEERYMKRILELRRLNNIRVLAEYEEILQHYAAYTEEVVAAFETALLRFDRIVLELGKAGSRDLQIYMEQVRELEREIKQTQFIHVQSVYAEESY